MVLCFLCSQDERRRKHVVHKAVCKKVLDLMLQCRPPPSFEVTCMVHFVYGDQTYKQRGTTGTAQRLEYMGSNGLPLNIQREVVFNSVHFPIPAALTLSVDVHAMTAILQQGVYCGAPFLSILTPLDIANVQTNLDDFMRQQLRLVAAAAVEQGLILSSLSSSSIMDSLVGRPLVSPGGPTYFNILPTLRNCDTKSYADGYLSWEHFLRCLGHALIWRVGGDGQYNLLWSYLKRRHPERYKYVWIDVGDFHSFAHFLFALNEMYWCVCLCAFSTALGRHNLQKRIPNLENNNFSHALTFLQAVAVAIVVYLTTVVHSPPPALLYSNPSAYYQQIHSASGKVLFHCLRYVGCPVLTYQRSIRSCDGSSLPALHAYAVHIHRCVHKTQEKVIMVIALLGYYCIHPSLQLLKRTLCAMSLLGRPGACMAFDRLVEYINLRQSQRNSSYRSFDAALHYTPHLLPMMLADAAYTAAVDGSDRDGDAGYDPRLIREVQCLVTFMETKLGHDLTVPSAQNLFWHTGNPVQLDSGTARDYRPWVRLWDVFSGRSAGDGSNAESCATWIYNLLRDHMFSR